MFIRNVKSFNLAMDNGYHTDFTGPVEGEKQNDDLIAAVRNVTSTYCGAGNLYCDDFV